MINGEPEDELRRLIIAFYPADGEMAAFEAGSGSAKTSTRALLFFPNGWFLTKLLGFQGARLQVHKQPASQFRDRLDSGLFSQVSGL